MEVTCSITLRVVYSPLENYITWSGPRPKEIMDFGPKLLGYQKNIKFLMSYSDNMVYLIFKYNNI